MRAMASQITGVSIVCSTVCSATDQRKHHAPRRWPLWGNPPVICEFPTQRASNAENISFDDVIMWNHVCAISCIETEMFLTDKIMIKMITPVGHKTTSATGMVSPGPHNGFGVVTECRKRLDPYEISRVFIICKFIVFGSLLFFQVEAYECHVAD